MSMSAVCDPKLSRMSEHREDISMSIPSDEETRGRKRVDVTRLRIEERRVVRGFCIAGYQQQVQTVI